MSNFFQFFLTTKFLQCNFFRHPSCSDLWSKLTSLSLYSHLSNSQLITMSHNFSHFSTIGLVQVVGQPDLSSKVTPSSQSWNQLTTQKPVLYSLIPHHKLAVIAIKISSIFSYFTKSWCSFFISTFHHFVSSEISKMIISKKPTAAKN